MENKTVSEEEKIFISSERLIPAIGQSRSPLGHSPISPSKSEVDDDDL